MATRKNHDENEDAARIVHGATCRDASAPADLESAWAAWSKGVHATDERTMTLLRAAFEAGHETGRRSFGSLGASKGGIARAAKLSSTARKDIARRAAESRWSRQRKES